MGTTREEMDWVRHSDLSTIQVHLNSGEVFHFFDSDGRVTYYTPSHNDSCSVEDGRLEARRGPEGWDIRVMRPFEHPSWGTAHEIGEAYYIPHASVSYISIDCKTKEEREARAQRHTNQYPR